MKGSLLVGLLLALAIIFFELKTPDQTLVLYNEWKAKLNARFDIEEDAYRFKIFQQNLDKVHSHNSKVGKTHTEGLNQFCFLTQEEFIAQYLSVFESNPKNQPSEIQIENGPTIDWVSWGAVSPVKNQGQCPASYAFSAVAALEGLSAIYYRNPQELSVQQIIDCSSSVGNQGCQTGTMTATFSYVMNKGITTQLIYPFKGYVQPCQTEAGLFRIGGYSLVNGGDCVGLANVLAQRPVSVAVDGRNMQFYTSGIFYNCANYLTLALTLVGMDDSAWKLKNSWGSNWGEAGYIRIGRGDNCGICQAGSYPNP